jgi:hypothetical protein
VPKTLGDPELEGVFGFRRFGEAIGRLLVGTERLGEAAGVLSLFFFLKRENPMIDEGEMGDGDGVVSVYSLADKDQLFVEGSRCQADGAAVSSKI